MNTRTKRAASVGASLLAVGALVVGAWAVGSNVRATPEAEPTPTPTVSQEAEPVSFVPRISVDTEERRAAAAEESARIQAERAAAEAAAAEAARIAAEEAARQAEQQSGGGTPSTPEAPAGPSKCPAGTVAGQVDENGNESMCQTPCSEWVDTDGDGNAETCARP
jgi:hypothetical protein